MRNPAVQVLLAEAERTVVVQYLHALMQGRLVCCSEDERIQAAERLEHDAAQFKELFLSLVSACWAGKRSNLFGEWEPRAGSKSDPNLPRA